MHNLSFQDLLTTCGYNVHTNTNKNTTNLFKTGTDILSKDYSILQNKVVTFYNTIIF